MRIISLISGLMLLTLTTLKAETTSNLVSQDFTTGWSGTNINSTHGNNTIAGIDGKYVESDAVSLNEVGINKESLNEGFSVVGSAEAWFWNSTEQSVTSTIKATNDNGYTSTQIRTWEPINNVQSFFIRPFFNFNLNKNVQLGISQEYHSNYYFY